MSSASLTIWRLDVAVGHVVGAGGAALHPLWWRVADVRGRHAYFGGSVAAAADQHRPGPAAPETCSSPTRRHWTGDERRPSSCAFRSARGQLFYTSYSEVHTLNSSGIHPVSETSRSHTPRSLSERYYVLAEISKWSPSTTSSTELWNNC